MPSRVKLEDQDRMIELLWAVNATLSLSFRPTAAEVHEAVYGGLGEEIDNEAVQLYLSMSAQQVFALLKMAFPDVKGRKR